MIAEWASAAAVASAAAAWAVRGRASGAFGPNVWRGPSTRRAIALTFDDGPSESTPALLETLAQFSARATFFQCGANARRLPDIARAVSRAGHEIGNHTQRHPRLWLRTPEFVANEIAQAQSTLNDIHGAPPRWFRAPYGVRWFGMREAMRQHHLTHAAWTTISRDWSLSSAEVSARLRKGLTPGAILCLHDGRELRANPNVRVTLEAVAQFLAEARAEGYELVTLSELMTS